MCAGAGFSARPIRIVVAFPPGGPTDFVGRLTAQRLTTLLGQRVYIENRAGGNRTVGGDNVAKSAPDGYSLFLTTAGAVTVSPHVMPKVPYDALRDFAPVVEVVTNSEVLVVSPSLGTKTAKAAATLPAAAAVELAGILRYTGHSRLEGPVAIGLVRGVLPGRSFMLRPKSMPDVYHVR